MLPKSIDISADRSPMPDPLRVADLGNGGALLLFTLRTWVDAFVAGYCPPPCLARAWSRLGCPDVPVELLRTLRLLRGSRQRPVEFHGPASAVLTAAERRLLAAVAAGAAGDRGALARASVRMAGRDVGPELARRLEAVGRALDNAALAVWKMPERAARGPQSAPIGDVAGPDPRAGRAVGHC